MFSLNLFCLRLIGFLSVLLISCNGPASKISRVDEQISKVEQDTTQGNDQDWSQLEIRMAELEEDLKVNRTDYSNEQIKEIGRLQGRYVKLAFKKGVTDFRKGLEDLQNQAEGFLEGLND